MERIDVTLQTATIYSDYAVDSIEQKLQEAGGVIQTQLSVDDAQVVLVQWEDEQLSTIVEALIDCLLGEWLYSAIAERIHGSHSYLTDDEYEYVSLLVYHALKKAELPQWESVYKDVQGDLRGILQFMLPAGHVVHAGELMRFRAKNLFQAVDIAIDEMVEQFLVDREYEEFVGMLRYMLDAQPKTDEILNVFCTDYRVWICNQTGQLVRDEQVTAAVVRSCEDGDVNSEDLAMSILITKSPCQIIIHDLTRAAPWPSFSETVDRVFLGRANRCHDCSACQELLKTWDSHSQLDGPQVGND